jgi:hypothetical protein
MLKKLILAAFVAASFGGAVVSAKPAAAEITFEYSSPVVVYTQQDAGSGSMEDYYKCIGLWCW